MTDNLHGSLDQVGIMTADTWPPPRIRRAGLLARLLRRPCPVCEQHKWYRDPYRRARPACPESWHRTELGRRVVARERLELDPPEVDWIRPL